MMAPSDFDTMSSWFHFRDAVQQRRKVSQGSITCDDSTDSWTLPAYSEIASQTLPSSGPTPSSAPATRRWSPRDSPRVLLRRVCEVSLTPLRTPAKLDSLSRPKKLGLGIPNKKLRTSSVVEKEDQKALAEELYAASCAGDLGHMELLLSLGAPVDGPVAVPYLYTAFKPAKAGWLSPLAGAAGAGELNACKLLLAKGASINPSTRQSSSPPLHQACRSDDAEITEWLLQNGADIDGLNCYNTTPLMYAVKYGSAQLVRSLLERSPNLELRSFVGTAATHWCIWPGHEDTLELLLQAGADPSVRDAGGATPLHFAAASGLTVMVTILLKYGANPLRKTSAGVTPAQMANDRGYGDCAEVLVIAESLM